MQADSEKPPNGKYTPEQVEKGKRILGRIEQMRKIRAARNQQEFEAWKLELEQREPNGK